jgi:hypothetical protein
MKGSSRVKSFSQSINFDDDDIGARTPENLIFCIEKYSQTWLHLEQAKKMLTSTTQPHINTIFDLLQMLTGLLLIALL